MSNILRSEHVDPALGELSGYMSVAPYVQVEFTIQPVFPGGIIDQMLINNGLGLAVVLQANDFQLIKVGQFLN